MAQALFDEHPLEEYLRDAGESSLTIPGVWPELERELDPYYDLVDDDSPDEGQPDWLPQYIIEFLEILQATLPSVQPPNKTNSFVERFKYNIISSSLLAPTLPTPHAKRLSQPLSIPGQHNLTPSEDLDQSPTLSVTPIPLTSSDPSYGPITLSIAFMAIAFSVGYHVFALLSVIGALFSLYHLINATESSKNDTNFPFNALDDLIAASNIWESTVQDAVTYLEKEERTHVLGFAGPSSPSPLRVALHSCLQATQSQCDNIRHLFTALTSPTNLSQISEMYAPPSPTKSIFESNSPLFSFPLPHRQSAPITPQNKRSTWNGSYASLGYTGSPTNFLVRRRDRHRMNLSEVFQPGTSSAPATPFPPTPLAELSRVVEHSTTEELPSSDSGFFSPSASHFGSAALRLQRQRRNGGMEALSRPSDSALFSDLKSPPSGRTLFLSSTISSPSKFTAAQTSRHPLSYSALTVSLQGALSAKRYTCSHLLALRFEDDEDEGYWEDVRSIISLLTSSLSDGASRLSAALHEVEQQNLQDQHPTPETVVSQLDVSGSEDTFSQPINLDSEVKRRKYQSKTSFAPMPTHISRFAAHVAAIGSALDDARENLEQCVAALRSDPLSSPTFGPSRQLRQSRSRSNVMETPTGEGAEEEEESPALQAYERLRRELGMALRECERGRERLLELVNPPVPSDDDDDEFDDLPGLGHDGSEDSDKPEANSPSSGDEDDLQINAAQFQPSVVTTEGASVDDATLHLLSLTSTQHLPLPGIEEVFEADTGPRVAFNRERSKLSREERIKLAKARRESGLGTILGIGQEGGGAEEEHANQGVEKWGPGGDVVQELKDVIWKVSERKRKMADSAHSQSSEPMVSTLESA